MKKTDKGKILNAQDASVVDKATLREFGAKIDASRCTSISASQDRARRTSSLTPAEVAAPEAATVATDALVLAGFARSGLAGDLPNKWLEAVRTAEVPDEAPKQEHK